MQIKLLILFTLTLKIFTTTAQVTFESLALDTTITGFHYAADFQGTTVYTKNGLPDLSTTNPTAFSITITQEFNYNDAKEQFMQFIEMSKLNNYTISDLIQKDTLINNNPAFILSYTDSDSNSLYMNLIFNAFIMKGNTCILFMSGDLDNGKYIEKFKETFYSLKI